MAKAIIPPEDDLTHSELSFLKELEEYSFESKMIVCQRFASRIMSCSEVDMQRAFDQNIMPWELEAFAAFSVVYDIDGVERQIEMDAFSKIITKIRNYWHPELTLAGANGTYADTFMMISALQQFPVQGVFLQKLFRYDYFFNFVNSNVDMKTEFCQKFKTPYIDFELFAYIIFVYCSQDAHKLGTAIDCQRLIAKAFKKDKVFQELCIEKEIYKNELTSLYRGNVLDYYFGLKIQYVYPLIAGSEFTYIPSPYLVVNAVTESLLNRLTFGNKKLRNTFGKEVIENYLLDIYKEVPDVTWISPEFAYIVGREENRTSDVLVSEGNYCTFYDTKAFSPSLKVRQFSQEEIDREIEIYAEDVLQVYQQILNYSESYYALDKIYDQKHLFGVVVVLEDAVVPREKVYNKAFEMRIKKVGSISDNEKGYVHSHIKIVPLRQIEAMVLQNMSFLPCLLAQAEHPEKWNDLNFATPNTEHGLLPIYEQFVSQIKREVIDYLKQ
ncbi:MAG: hypothetical protein A4E56_03030 [Pelotomaculum sp. PtaU1.Bin065]|nr:MAG: hypothetical protein A4E56_03030 [Pelotomaculum sp. PtaU1.Bin065]